MRHQLLLVLPLVLATWTASGSAQPEGDQKALAEIREVFARLDRAINEHDLAGVMAAYAPSEPIVWLGTGEGERWVGKKEIQGQYQELFKFFDPGTQETRCTWTMQEIRGDFSWIASMCRITDFLKNQKRDYGINLTAVLEKLDGKWYFRVVHVSSGSSDEETIGEEN